MTLVKRKVGGLGFLLGKHRNSFVVTNVTAGSSAQEDGQLQLYDEVRGIDNKHFNDIQSLINYISEIDFGKGVELTIKRYKSGENGKKQMNGIRKEARKTTPVQPDINKINGIATHCQQELGVIEKNVKNCNKEKREQMVYYYSHFSLSSLVYALIVLRVLFLATLVIELNPNPDQLETLF